MSAARARQAGERPGVTLALAPPPPRLARPRLSRWQRLRRWRVHGEVSYRLRYRVLGAIVRRVATRQFRERAWLAGFNWSFDDRREPFWAGLLDEFGSGNQAGIAASMPIWSTRQQPLPRRPGRRARVARHLPASRAELPVSASGSMARSRRCWCSPGPSTGCPSRPRAAGGTWWPSTRERGRETTGDRRPARPRARRRRHCRCPRAPGPDARRRGPRLLGFRIGPRAGRRAGGVRRGGMAGRPPGPRVRARGPSRGTALSVRQRGILGQALADAIDWRAPGTCRDWVRGTPCCGDHAEDARLRDTYLALARELGIGVDR